MEEVTEQKTWKEPAPDYPPSSFYHEAPDEPTLRLNAIPKWIIFLFIFLFILGIVFIWFIYFRKPSVKTLTQAPTPTITVSGCKVKPVCNKFDIPQGCHLIDPGNPCRCPSAYACPNAE